MAPRANWKGYLRLSLVSCPVALYPATTEREKIRFHQINRKTGHRIRYLKVDAETQKPIDGDDIVKGYEVSKGEFVEVTDEELEAVAIESAHTIDIDQFVPRDEIDPLYAMRPYYIAPEDEAGAQAFAVIREAIDKEAMVALGRVVLTTREHIIALEPRGKGLMGTLLRYPYEVRNAEDFFDDIPDEKIPKDMLDLAVHILKSKAGHFRPEKFEDQYESALRELVKKKRKGEPIEVPAEPRKAQVINLMDALRRSVEGERKPARGSSARRKPAAGSVQRRKRHPARASRKAG